MAATRSRGPPIPVEGLTRSTPPIDSPEKVEMSREESIEPICEMGWGAGEIRRLLLYYTHNRETEIVPRVWEHIGDCTACQLRWEQCQREDAEAYLKVDRESSLKEIFHRLKAHKSPDRPANRVPKIVIVAEALAKAVKIDVINSWMWKSEPGQPPSITPEQQKHVFLTHCNEYLDWLGVDRLSRAETTSAPSDSPDSDFLDIVSRIEKQLKDNPWQNRPVSLNKDLLVNYLRAIRLLGHPTRRFQVDVEGNKDERVYGLEFSYQEVIEEEQPIPRHWTGAAHPAGAGSRRRD